MIVYTLTIFINDFVWNMLNIKNFHWKTMLGQTAMLPNPTFTRWCKPKTNMDRLPLMLSNTCGEMKNRFTNICGITLSKLIFINNIAQQRWNRVFVLEKVTVGQPVYKNSFKFQMWIKIRYNVRQLLFQCKILQMIWKRYGDKKEFLVSGDLTLCWTENLI